MIAGYRVPGFFGVVRLGQCLSMFVAQLARKHQQSMTQASNQPAAQRIVQGLEPAVLTIPPGPSLYRTNAADKPETVG